MTKLYRVELNSKGAPNFSTAVEVPEQQWIPCSEMLPDKEGYYLTTSRSYLTDDGCAGRVEILAYGKPLMPMNGKAARKPKWYDYDRDGDYYRDGVVAWMPLPEPYKEESDVD